VYAGLSILPLIAALWIAGVDPNYLLGNDVTTTNAYVYGDMVQVSAPLDGTITKILTQVGDPVSAGQTVAYLESPAQGSNRGPIVPAIRANGTGTLVHLAVVVGQTVTQGQQIGMIADLRQLWVVAVVDSGSFSPVRPGDSADVYIPALDQWFHGRVSQIVPDVQQTSPRGSLAAASSGSRTGTDVPVRVDFDYGDALVYPGMTANVTIYVRS
jgi:cobalt-zinc-cadmium efflux system membrane fusion protein